MRPEPEDPLHWSATLYALGEMSPGEEAAFEHRLLEDQDAREALASAVGLIEAIGSAAALAPDGWNAQIFLPSPSGRGEEDSRPVHKLSKAKVALALAASVLALAGTGLWWANRPNPEPSASASVAEAWSEIRHQSDPVAVASEAEPDAVAAEAEVPGDRPVPSWLLAASGSAPEPVEED